MVKLILKASKQTLKHFFFYIEMFYLKKNSKKVDKLSLSIKQGGKIRKVRLRCCTCVTFFRERDLYGSHKLGVNL